MAHGDPFLELVPIGETAIGEEGERRVVKPELPLVDGDARTKPDSLSTLERGSPHIRSGADEDRISYELHFGLVYSDDRNLA